MADISATLAKEKERKINEAFHRSRGGIARGIARFLLQIRGIRKMTFRKVPRVRRAHRSYPIIVLIREKTIAREGTTKEKRGLSRKSDQWQSFKPK